MTCGTSEKQANALAAPAVAVAVKSENKANLPVAAPAVQCL